MYLIMILLEGEFSKPNIIILSYYMGLPVQVAVVFLKCSM